jgi:hypothetical protein
MPRIRAALTIGDWERLTLSLDEETTGASPPIKIMHKQLQGSLDEFRKLALEQKRLDAEKQAVTRRMNEILEEGRKTASTIKLGLKLHLGASNEQLVKFGIRPFRGRRRRKPEALPSDAESSPSSGEPLT